MSSEAVAINNPDYKVADITLADFGRKESPLPKRRCQVSSPCAKSMEISNP